MASMRAGDVIVRPESFADADGNRLLADVQVGKPRHQGPRVQIVHLVFKHANSEHLPVHTKPKVGVGLGWSLGSVYGC